MDDKTILFNWEELESTKALFDKIEFLKKVGYTFHGGTTEMVAGSPIVLWLRLIRPDSSIFAWYGNINDNSEETTNKFTEWLNMQINHEIDSMHEGRA